MREFIIIAGKTGIVVSLSIVYPPGQSVSHLCCIGLSEKNAGQNTDISILNCMGCKDVELILYSRTSCIKACRQFSL